MRGKSVVRELPLVIGVALGWLTAWWLGHAFVLDDVTHGYGWHDYLNNAWMVVHRTHVGFNAFREPLHAWMLGQFGELVESYANGAILLSSTGVFLLVLGAGFTGRALGGVWCGALCAAAIPWAPNSSAMATWANAYGVSGAFAGLAVGFAALSFRRPRVSLLALAGASAGIAWGMDPRSLALSAGAVVLGLLSLTVPKVAWWRRGLGVLVLGLGLSIGPRSHDALWLEPVNDPAWSDRVAFQKSVIARWTRKIAVTKQPCADYRSMEPLEAAQGPCGAAILSHNRDAIMPRHLPFGAPLTLLGLGLALLPGRQGWRGSLAGLSLWSGAAGLALLAVSTPMPDRYVVSFVFVLTVAAPIGLARLVSTVLPRRVVPLGLAVAMIALGVWGWRVDPSERFMSTSLTRSPRQTTAVEAARVVKGRLGADDLYLDCSEMFVSTAILPRITQPPPPDIHLRNMDICLRWIAKGAPPDRTRWVSVMEEAPRERRSRGKDGRFKVEPVTVLKASPEWALVDTVAEFQLWRRTSD